MMVLDKVCSEMMDSKCKRDYKNHHYWERRGILLIYDDTYMIWQCTQCELCLAELLHFITDKNDKVNKKEAE